MLEDPESTDNQVFEDPLEIRVTEDLTVSKEKWFVSIKIFSNF